MALKLLNKREVSAAIIYNTSKIDVIYVNDYAQKIANRDLIKLSDEFILEYDSFDNISNLDFKE